MKKNQKIQGFVGFTSIAFMGALMGALTFSACSHTPATNRRSLASSSGDSVVPALDFDLYKDEAWEGGSREGERKIFDEQMQEVVTAQQNLQKKRKSDQPDRVFHQKLHGCAVGTLEVHDNAPSTLANTMFSGKKKSYTVLARFSNGVGLSQHDLMPDVRGIGMKIFGVHDNQDGTDKTIDFTMTNSKVAFGNDAQDFIDFMKSQDDPGHSQVAYFASHPEVAKALFKATLKYTSSLTQTSFYSGHAYLADTTAMRLHISPETEVVPEQTEISSHYPANIDDWSVKAMMKSGAKLQAFLNSLAVGDLSEDWDKSHNYLHDDLAKKLDQGSVRYVLSVQLEKDANSTPIEKNLTEWKESDAPSTAVADLVFDKQAMDDPELTKLCQEARFTPGHYVSQHRPLSNMGRARVFAYYASATGRGASETEVSEAKILEIKKRLSGR